MIIQNDKSDVNVCDNDGYTAAMYLTEMGCSNELYSLRRRNCSYDFINMENQSVMSILIDKLYVKKNDRDAHYYKIYVNIMNDFINQQFDFNIPVDSDENTAFMVMIIVNDMTTAKFCAKQLKRLDLSVKNKYGESATSLCYKLNHYKILPLFKKNPTYDYNYRDPLNQNTLLMISAINNVSAMVDLLENDPGIINEVNSKNENTLIIATKINKTKAVEELLERGIDINHQDNLGNTALHYAIEIQSPFLIHRLMSKNPDIHIKNNEGKSPLDIANEIDQDKDKILEILMNPSCNIKKLKFKNSVSFKYEEEIKSYIVPGANNHYPEFKSYAVIERVKKDLYTDDSKGDEPISRKNKLLYTGGYLLFALAMVVFMITSKNSR